LSRILSSDERRSSGLGTSVPCSLKVSFVEGSEMRRGSHRVQGDTWAKRWVSRDSVVL
jgi:hypothetical protein